MCCQFLGMKCEQECNTLLKMVSIRNSPSCSCRHYFSKWLDRIPIYGDLEKDLLKRKQIHHLPCVQKHATCEYSQCIVGNKLKLSFWRHFLLSASLVCSDRGLWLNHLLEGQLLFAFLQLWVKNIIVHKAWKQAILLFIYFFPVIFHLAEKSFNWLTYKMG